jgi:hypothetical protein
MHFTVSTLKKYIIQWGSRHDFLYIRGWIQMATGTKWFIFLKQEYSKARLFDGYTLCTLCYSLYNARDTQSVHNYLLKSWWSRLLYPWSSCYVFPPPLSGINWCSLPPSGGPGPPTPKVASLFPRSAHTPSPWFRTNGIAGLFDSQLVFCTMRILSHCRAGLCLNRVNKNFLCDDYYHT